MKTKFNKTKYNINRLQPRPEDIELNKCTHQIFDKESGRCVVCETKVDPDNCFDYNELILAIETITEHLESMKMIVNSCMNKKEIKASQKYFDMIPLLNNLDVLHDICIEQLNTTDLDIVDLYEHMEYNNQEDDIIILDYEVNDEDEYNE